MMVSARIIAVAVPAVGMVTVMTKMMIMMMIIMMN